uniref:Uncharacterized protein n=1 Tax=Arundo donax TaxID=35708 RepID=A0A0A9B4Z9_ARUDO
MGAVGREGRGVPGAVGKGAGSGRRNRDKRGGGGGVRGRGWRGNPNLTRLYRAGGEGKMSREWAIWALGP